MVDVSDTVGDSAATHASDGCFQIAWPLDHVLRAQVGARQLGLWRACKYIESLPAYLQECVVLTSWIAASTPFAAVVTDAAASPSESLEGIAFTAF